MYNIYTKCRWKSLFQGIFLYLYSHCFAEGGGGQGHTAQENPAAEDQDLAVPDGGHVVQREDRVQGEGPIALKEEVGVGHEAQEEGEVEVDPIAQKEGVPGKRITNIVVRLSCSYQIYSQLWSRLSNNFLLFF